MTADNKKMCQKAIPTILIPEFWLFSLQNGSQSNAGNSKIFSLYTSLFCNSEMFSLPPIPCCSGSHLDPLSPKQWWKWNFSLHYHNLLKQSWVMRIKQVITKDERSWYFKFSLLVPYEMYGEQYREYAFLYQCLKG